jgi:glycosyltransferase involved in cell wall biosynthesis
MKNSLSILMISPQFRPLVGGYERAAERLSGALVKLGNGVTVITDRRVASWPSHELVEGVVINRLPCIYRPHLHMLSSLLAFAWFLLWQGRRFDVWHVHQYGLHAALALALGKLLQRPVVLKLTNSGEQGLSRTLAQGCCPQLLAYLHRQVDAVVALTRETAAEAETFGISDGRVHVIGNGVNIEVYRPRSEHERCTLKMQLGLGSEKVIMFVGRLSDAKNVEGLLMAWSLTNEKLRSTWKLVLVGDGPLRHVLEAKALEYLVTDSVRFVGLQKNIEDWLGAADIYISTSWNEGLSNTLLEAMATGLPVVATRVSGIAELVVANQAGITVEIGDMHGVTKGIVVLAGDGDMRTNCGEAGRRAIESNYSLLSVANRTSDIYMKLLDR